MVGCCLINVDDMIMLDAHEECEFLRSPNGHMLIWLIQLIVCIMVDSIQRSPTNIILSQFTIFQKYALKTTLSLSILLKNSLLNAFFAETKLWTKRCEV